eukprot:CAMPEP_0196727950 /NCGR_PEP_ID=MMETSP1091-20130531/8791_1 /TAXON_ID=302021 /ORGANISM="Rhodomonas sp., Strain CCMP768" /LENGTH=538 /DNA_ID=CAMNT_0042070637 /DNA_START=56 /DNA_END=1672 /DNA_ORIENTATION=-
MVVGKKTAQLCCLAMVLMQGSLVLGYSPLSFHPPFQNMRVEGWNIMGSTMVTEQFVRVTSAEAGQEGAIWSVDRVPYADWEVEIAFKCTGARYLGGDGFGLWFTEKSEVFGGTFGNQEDFVGLGIIFDTYDNDGKRDNPAISAVYSDGSVRFNHDDDGRKNIIPGATCKINYRNPRVPIMAKVKYQDGTLIVSYDMRSRGVWTECFRTSELMMPPSYFIGITAHTGQVADNHDIYKLLTTSLDAVEAPPPEQDVMATEKEHHPGESETEQKEWHKDDDRHLQRFADAIARFIEMMPETQAMASEARRELMQEREEEANMDIDAEPIMGDEGDGPGGDGLGQHFKDEVSATLSLIQEEIKQIAHEMRGTITLAHAVTQGDPDEMGGGGGGGVSGSELLTGVSEVVTHSTRTVSHDVNAAKTALNQEIDGLKKDVRDVHNTIRNSVVRTQQEFSAKLSAVTNDVTKMKSTMEDLKKRTDYTHGKLESSASQLKDHIETNLGSGGLSYVTLLLTQIPLVAFVVYSKFFAGKQDQYSYKQRV